MLCSLYLSNFVSIRTENLECPVKTLIVLHTVSGPRNFELCLLVLPGVVTWWHDSVATWQRGGLVGGGLAAWRHVSVVTWWPGGLVGGGVVAWRHDSMAAWWVVVWRRGSVAAW